MAICILQVEIYNPRSANQEDTMSRELKLGDRILIMGILNVTPDSFYDGGRYEQLELALERAQRMIEEGADIIDVGGESTRPGAEPVPLETELGRVVPVIREIRKRFPNVIISVDTYKSAVAEEALRAGADIVNDISGLGFDPRMAEVVADFNAYVVIMHIKGTPKNMQVNPVYDDVIGEIMEFFRRRIEIAVEKGVSRDRIILDPGIGFGKKLHHNLRILNEIDRFKEEFGLPLLVGASRKSMIGMVLGIKSPEDRLEGTLAISAYCATKSVDIIRVHDVLPNLRVVRMVEAIKNWRKYS